MKIPADLDPNPPPPLKTQTPPRRIPRSAPDSLIFIKLNKPIINQVYIDLCVYIVCLHLFICESLHDIQATTPHHWNEYFIIANPSCEIHRAYQNVSDWMIKITLR